MGVEIDAGFDQEFGLIRYFYSSDADVNIYNPVMQITVTDIEYFSMDSDDPERRFHKCVYYATFPHIVDETPPRGYAFDYTSGSGTTGDYVSLDWFAEGYASIYSYDAMVDDDGELILDSAGETQASEVCDWLNTNGYTDLFDGMHVGIGYGGLSDFMRTTYWNDFADDLADYEDSVLGAYVAINHPNSEDDDGYDFVAYDWNSAVAWQGEASMMELTYGDGTTGEEQVLEVAVDEDSYLIFGSPDDPATLRRQSAYWFEDFPNLDLSLMKEGVPASLLEDAGDGG